MTNVLILSTCFRPNVGGVETHLDDLISEGTRRNVSFVVITYQPLVTKAREKLLEKGRGFVIYRVPWIRMNLFLILERYPVLEFIYLFPGIFIASFVYLLLNPKVETIHSQGIAAGTAGMILGKLFSKKTILSTHSIYNFPQSGLYSDFVRLLFKNTDKILVLSKQSEKEVNKLGNFKDKTSVFTYWVDQERFSPKTKVNTRKMKLFKSDFVCLFVGRLVGVKGVNELLEASKAIDNHIKIAIAGDGPLKEKVIREAKGNKNLIFLGKIDNNDLPGYYNSADVLIVPSVHEEGFGRVILEALSCGLPVIGSRRGAIPEAMDSSVGYLVDVSSDSIANTLKHIYKNKIELNIKRRNARKYALKKYSKGNVLQIIKYY